MTPTDILAFCFPDDLDASQERHFEFWGWFMRGGADHAIRSRFASLVESAAAGQSQAWADTAEGRLALILVLDQFSRSLYRDSPRAYAQDPAALALCEEGLNNGHFDALDTPWARTLYSMPLVHAEGPTLAERAARNVELAETTLAMAPESLKPVYEFCLAQSRRHKAVIDRFGRHPHRNAILGRPSTPAEQEYLAQGQFPHLQAIGTKGQEPVGHRLHVVWKPGE